MEVKAYHPLAKVSFFTEKGELVAKATNDPHGSMDDDVVNINTSRSIEEDSPTFSINLTRKKPWHQWVRSNDLVIIQMKRPPEKMQRVFIGLVDDSRKKVVVGNNTVQRVVSVTGRGIAKSFVKFDIGVVPEAEYASTTTGWLLTAGIQLAGSAPSKIVSAIWEVIARKHINYSWSNDKSLFDYTIRNFKDRDSLTLLDESSVMNWQGSVNSLIKNVAEAPFYEVFWEMDDEYDALYVRPTPFNQKEWEELPKLELTDAEVVSEDIGRSDVETFSIYSVGAKSLFSPQDTYKTFGVLPYWNEEYAKKYGNARLHVETSYTSVADSEDAELQTNVMTDLMKDLYNWNIMNNTFFNGTLVLMGSNKYKVGTRIEYDSKENGDKLEFYVTSVSHTFTNYGAWTSVVGVTRGIKAKNRFAKPWGTHKEYSGLGLLPFDPEGARDALNVGSGIGTGGGVDFAKASGVIAEAESILANGINGVMVKYVFGGNSPFSGALDCSSFTQFVYSKAAGIDLGRTTGQQVQKGSKVSKENLQPGDLVFFKGTYNSTHIYGVSHVGIYIGDGKFIHNSASNTGGVQKGELSNSYWTQHWLMGRRVLSDNTNGGLGSGIGGSVRGGGTKYTATAYGATAVNLMGGPGWTPTFTTATGTTPIEGRTIAVDRTKIPLHSLVTINCPSFPSVNGTYTAEDVGGAIKGNKIDIYFNDLPPEDPYAARKRMLEFGQRDVYVQVIRKGKG